MIAVITSDELLKDINGSGQARLLTDESPV
jgi:hypothetical protein